MYGLSGRFPSPRDTFKIIKPQVQHLASYCYNRPNKRGKITKVAKGLRSDNVAHIRGLQPIKMEANTTHYDKPATPKEEGANQERDTAEASGQSYFFFVVGAQVKQSHGAVWSAVCSRCHLWGRAGLLHTGHPQT